MKVAESSSKTHSKHAAELYGTEEYSSVGIRGVVRAVRPAGSSVVILTREEITALLHYFVLLFPIKVLVGHMHPPVVYLYEQFCHLKIWKFWPCCQIVVSVSLFLSI